MHDLYSPSTGVLFTQKDLPNILTSVRLMSANVSCEQYEITRIGSILYDRLIGTFPNRRKFLEKKAPGMYPAAFVGGTQLADTRQIGFAAIDSGRIEVANKTHALARFDRM